MCVHCGVRPVNRPRQLCYRDYYTPAVRERYPDSGSKYARRGSGTTSGVRPLAPSPTAAGIGSEAKIAVMAERARLGLALYHPSDATDSGAVVEDCGQAWRGREPRVRRAAKLG